MQHLLCNHFTWQFLFALFLGHHHAIIKEHEKYTKNCRYHSVLMQPVPPDELPIKQACVRSTDNSNTYVEESYS